MLHVLLIQQFPDSYGYFVVFIATLAAIFSTPGQAGCVGTTISYVVGDLDVDRTTVSFLYSVATLSSAATLPALGRAIDHYGPRRMAMLFTFFLGVSCVLYSVFTVTVVDACLWLYLLRLLGQGGLFLVSMNAINQWFIEQRGAVMRIVQPCVSLAITGGAASVVYHLTAVTFGGDWRASYAILGRLEVFVLLPLVWLFLPDRPENYGVLPDGRGSFVVGGRAPVVGPSRARGGGMRVALELEDAVEHQEMRIMQGGGEQKAGTRKRKRKKKRAQRSNERQQKAVSTAGPRSGSRFQQSFLQSILAEDDEEEEYNLHHASKAAPEAEAEAEVVAAPQAEVPGRNGNAEEDRPARAATDDGLVRENEISIHVHEFVDSREGARLGEAAAAHEPQQTVEQQQNQQGSEYSIAADPNITAMFAAPQVVGSSRGGSKLLFEDERDHCVDEKEGGVLYPVSPLEESDFAAADWTAGKLDQTSTVPRGHAAASSGSSKIAGLASKTTAALGVASSRLKTAFQSNRGPLPSWRKTPGYACAAVDGRADAGALEEKASLGEILSIEGVPDADEPDKESSHLHAVADENRPAPVPASSRNLTSKMKTFVEHIKKNKTALKSRAKIYNQHVSQRNRNHAAAGGEKQLFLEDYHPELSTPSSAASYSRNNRWKEQLSKMKELKDTASAKVADLRVSKMLVEKLRPTSTEGKQHGAGGTSASSKEGVKDGKHDTSGASIAVGRIDALPGVDVKHEATGRAHDEGSSTEVDASDESSNTSSEDSSVREQGENTAGGALSKWYRRRAGLSKSTYLSMEVSAGPFRKSAKSHHHNEKKNPYPPRLGVESERNFTLRQAVRTYEFWVFATTNGVSGGCLAALLIHMDSILFPFRGTMLSCFYGAMSLSAGVTSFCAAKNIKEQILKRCAQHNFLMVLAYFSLTVLLKGYFAQLVGRLEGHDVARRRTTSTEEHHHVPADAILQHNAAAAQLGAADTVAAGTLPGDYATAETGGEETAPVNAFLLPLCLIGIVVGMTAGLTFLIQGAAYANAFGRLHNGNISSIAKSIMVVHSAVFPLLLSLLHSWFERNYIYSLAVLALYPIAVFGFSLYVMEMRKL
eukprot:g1850.t1